jgi:hypothetical protein
MYESDLGTVLPNIYDHSPFDKFWLTSAGPYTVDSPCVIADEKKDPGALFDRWCWVCLVSDVCDEVPTKKWHLGEQHVRLFNEAYEPTNFLALNTKMVDR